MSGGLVHLIVNADDFGQSPGVNRGIIQAHELGIVTSASLMVRWPAAEAAARYCRGNSRISLGLHIDLCEWKHSNGEWIPIYEVVPFQDEEAVRKEIVRQFETFEKMAGKPPSHVDSHQHFHTRQPARAATLELAGALGIPARSCDSPARYCGRFYGQTGDGQPCPELIGVDALLKVLEELPEGYTELGCHPAIEPGLETMYSSEREIEVATLCDSRIRSFIDQQGIRLCTFAEAPKVVSWRP